MPRFLIQHPLGEISPDELEAAAEHSTRVRVEQFPEIEWEHSHVVRDDAGLTTYCVYSAPSEQQLRDHSAAAGLPVDGVHEIVHELTP